MWEWWWTTKLLARGRETGADGHVGPVTRGRWDGTCWRFEPNGQDTGLHEAVQHNMLGDKLVKLRCCGYDFRRTWDQWQDDLNRWRHALFAQLELSVLARTMDR